MEEKEKNKGKQSKLAGNRNFVLASIGFATCIIAVLILFGIWKSSYGLSNADCHDLPEAYEWNGVISWETSSESGIPITRENLTHLTSTSIATELQEYPYYQSIKHPAHNYVLELPIVENGSDNFSPLIVCSSSGELLQFLIASSYHPVFSLDGQYFAAGNQDERQIEIFNANTFELYRSIPHVGIIANFAFHPNEPLIALTTYSADGATLESWNYETEELEAKFPVELAGVGFLSFNEDGTLIYMYIRTMESEATFAWGIPPE